MKKTLLSLAFLSLTSLGFAQEKGIKFETELTWEQVKAKAKAENKSIFMDIYATWCGPCKRMDASVYPSEKVGLAMNPKFVSVKFQIDTTKNDNNLVKKWHADVSRMIKEENLAGLPTYFFFSPDGKLINRGSGFMDEDALIQLSEQSLNPANQYYSELEKYKQGKLLYSDMPRLAVNANEIGDMEMVGEIANNYINNYLFKNGSNELFTKDNLAFMARFMSILDEKVLHLFTEQQAKINSVLGDYGAQIGIIKYIERKYIPRMETWTKNKPNWNELEVMVKNKFGSLGEEAVLGSRMGYHLFVKDDWNAFEKYYVLYFKRAYKHPTWHVNNMSWSIFEHSQNPKVLEFACDTVMKYAIEEWYQNDVESWDTYANLLHKIGRSTEAIKWEEKAVKFKKGQRDEKVYTDALSKMKTGRPTWPIKTN